MSDGCGAAAPRPGFADYLAFVDRWAPRVGSPGSPASAAQFRFEFVRFVAAVENWAREDERDRPRSVAGPFLGALGVGRGPRT